MCEGVRCWGVAGGWAQLSVGQQQRRAQARLLGPARLATTPPPALRAVCPDGCAFSVTSRILHRLA